METALAGLEIDRSLVKGKIEWWIGIIDNIRQYMGGYIYGMLFFTIIFDNIELII